MMSVMLGYRAGNAFNDVAALAEVMIMVILAGAFEVLFAVVGMGLDNESRPLKMVKISVDGGEVYFWELGMDLLCCPSTVLQEKVEELVAVARASKPGGF